MLLAGSISLFATFLVIILVTVPNSNVLELDTAFSFSSIFDSMIPGLNQYDKIPQDIANTNNEFALDLYKQIKSDHDNTFFSPLSAYTAFSFLYEGARQNTAQEIQQVFGFEPVSDTRHTNIANLMSSINRDDPTAIVELANALWLRNGFNAHESFSAIGRDVYVSDITTLGPDTVQNVKQINAWGADKTRDKITQIVESDEISSVEVLITNAIYFKGVWETPFDPNSTYESYFVINDTSWRDRDFMVLEEVTFDYTKTDDVQVIRMPYNGDRLSMLVILPNELDGINALEESLSVDLLDQWRSELLPTELILHLPKFTMKTNYDLKSPLQSLGISDVFDGSADLTGISKDGLYVSGVKQSAFVNVNEEGTEAAAITSISISIGVPNIPIFHAGHPFLFIIQDDQSGTILFMGKVYDPIQE